MGNCCGKRKRKGRASQFDHEGTDAMHNAFRDLYETEHKYTKDLQFLTEKYLDPLKKVNFLGVDEIKTFDGVMRELTDKQMVFQGKMETAIDQLDHKPIAEVLCDTADLFIESEKNFAIYSRYGTLLNPVQRAISSDGVEKLSSFFDTRLNDLFKEFGASSPTSISTIDSLILKPSQRILLYSLILEQMMKLTEEGTKDNKALKEALDAMKRVDASMNSAIQGG